MMPYEMLRLQSIRQRFSDTAVTVQMIVLEPDIYAVNVGLT